MPAINDSRSHNLRERSCVSATAPVAPRCFKWSAVLQDLQRQCCHAPRTNIRRSGLLCIITALMCAVIAVITVSMLPCYAPRTN